MFIDVNILLRLVKVKACYSTKQVLKEGLCNFAPLKQFGVVYNEEDFTVFQSRLLHLQTYVSTVLELHTCSSQC